MIVELTLLDSQPVIAQEKAERVVEAQLVAPDHPAQHQGIVLTQGVAAKVGDITRIELNGSHEKLSAAVAEVS